MRPRKPMYRVVISSWGRGAGQWAARAAAGRGGCRTPAARPHGTQTGTRHLRHVSHADPALLNGYFSQLWSKTAVGPTPGAGQAPPPPGHTVWAARASLTPSSPPVAPRARRGHGSSNGTCLPGTASPRTFPTWPVSLSSARQPLVPTREECGCLIRLAGPDASHRPLPRPRPAPPRPTWRWMKTTEPSSLQVPPWRSTCSIRRIWRKRMPLRRRSLCPRRAGPRRARPTAPGRLPPTWP